MSHLWVWLIYQKFLFMCVFHYLPDWRDFWIFIRDVNRDPGPRDPKKLPDPGFQTTRKLPPRPLPHSETTGLPVQQGQSRHCSVVSETVATVSLRRSHLVHHYRRAHTTLGRHQSHHVTDHVLGRVDYSGWWLVPGYMCEMLQYGICRRYYVTVERRLRPGVVSHVHWSPAQTAFSHCVKGLSIWEIVTK